MTAHTRPWRLVAISAIALALLAALLVATRPMTPSLPEAVPPGAPATDQPPEGDATLRGVEVTRDEGASISGANTAPALLTQVRTLSGDKPVAGARIVIRANRTIVWEGSTDTEGQVAVVGAPPGNLEVVASATGLTPSELTFKHAQSDGPRTMTLRLADGHRVRGRVIDDRGQPVPDAIVEAASAAKIGSARTSARRVRTSSTGAFEFAALPAGAQMLTARWPEGWGGQGRRVRLPLAGTIDLLLARGAVIEGTVTHADTGEALAGATVRVSDINAGANAVVRTDALGRYRIGPFDPRRPPANIRVTRPGYRPATQDAVAERGLAAPHPYIDGRTILDLGLGSGDQVRIDFSLHLGAVVVGTVHGPDGPMANALVRANPSGGAPWTRTNAQGEYRLAGLAADPTLIAVQAAGYLQAGATSLLRGESLESSAAFHAMGVRPSFEQETVRNLRLERGRDLSIRVLDLRDEPLPRAKIWARVTDGRSQPLVTPDSNDGFKLSGVAAGGQLVIGATMDGYEGVEPAGVRVPVDGASKPIVVRMRRRKTLIVRGTLSSDQETELRGGYVQVAWVDRSGFALDPVGRWKLWASSKRHPVRSDGTYSVRLSGAPGRFAVRASALGHMAAFSADETATEDSPEAEVDLRLAPGNRATGSVLDALSGRPVQGAQVRVTASDNERGVIAMWHATPAVSDSAGVFVITEIPDGHHVLDVTAYGYVPAKLVADISASSGRIVVRLSPADGKIEGVVERDTGLPFEGARVHAQQGAHHARRVRSRPDGSFILEGLPHAPTTVAARAEGHVDARVAGVPVGTLDLRLVLEPGVVAAGVVLDRKGRPLRNAWIRFVPTRANRVGTWVRTDNAGRFRRTDMASGDHEIQVRLDGKHLSIGRADLPDEDLVVRR